MNRSKWKGPYINTALKKKNFNQKIIKILRNYFITPFLIGSVFKVHTGKTYKKLIVTEFMINKKFGHFCFTRQNFKFNKKN